MLQLLAGSAQQISPAIARVGAFSDLQRGAIWNHQVGGFILFWLHAVRFVNLITRIVLRVGMLITPNNPSVGGASIYCRRVFVASGFIVSFNVRFGAISGPGLLTSINGKGYFEPHRRCAVQLMSSTLPFISRQKRHLFLDGSAHLPEPMAASPPPLA